MSQFGDSSFTLLRDDVAIVTLLASIPARRHGLSLVGIGGKTRAFSPDVMCGESDSRQSAMRLGGFGSSSDVSLLRVGRVR